MRHLAALVVDDPQLARRDQLDALPRLDRGDRRPAERGVLRARLADGDERRRLGEAVDLRDLPAELALDALDGGGGRRRAGGQDAHAARAAPAAQLGSGALAMPISTVGAAQSIVIRSASMPLEHVRGSTLRRQTCVPPTAVTIQTNVQPLAWNIGSVHR